MATETTARPTPRGDDTIRCERCGVALADPAELEEHRQGHIEREAEGYPAVPGGPRYRCAFCNSAYDTAEELSTHHAEAHQK